MRDEIVATLMLVSVVVGVPVYAVGWYRWTVISTRRLWLAGDCHRENSGSYSDGTPVPAPYYYRSRKSCDTTHRRECWRPNESPDLEDVSRGIVLAFGWPYLWLQHRIANDVMRLVPAETFEKRIARLEASVDIEPLPEVKA